MKQRRTQAGARAAAELLGAVAACGAVVGFYGAVLYARRYDPALWASAALLASVLGFLEAGRASDWLRGRRQMRAALQALRRRHPGPGRSRSGGPSAGRIG
ncbi:MAG: hypothetical protein ACRD17_08410 [Terriglobales bacterium]